MRNKKKDEPNLIWIEQPTHDENGKSNTLSKGIDVWEMYNSDFNLTIKDICDILLCERKWVINHMKNNVKHIFLNHNFRTFLNAIDLQQHFNVFKPGNMLKDYYYFSRKDFYRWLIENTKITKQTIQINIIDYAEDPTMILNLKHEFNNKSTSIKEFKLLLSQYKSKLYSLLNKGGQNSLDNVVVLTERRASAIDVTKKEKLPDKFTTIKDLKGDKSLELAYRSLYSFGALKYTIKDSLVRYDVEYVHKGCCLGERDDIITIPYEIYLKNKKFKGLKGKNSSVPTEF